MKKTKKSNKTPIQTIQIQKMFQFQLKKILQSPIQRTFKIKIQVQEAVTQKVIKNEVNLFLRNFIVGS